MNSIQKKLKLKVILKNSLRKTRTTKIRRHKCIHCNHSNDMFSNNVLEIVITVLITIKGVMRSTSKSDKYIDLRNVIKKLMLKYKK